MRAFFYRHRFMLLFGTLLVVATLAWRSALARTALLEVAFLDVGQGDAAFIEFPEGTQVLIDGGPDASVLTELSEAMPPWDRTIDIVVATHPDADHLAGLLDVLTRYDVSIIIETGIRKETMLSRSWEEALAREGAEIVLADAPKRLRIGDVAAFDLLWPQESHAGEVLEEPNRYAVVAQLAYGETTFLFPADIERWSEDRLRMSAALHDVDALKVAHHGSKTSTSEAFLDAVTPEIAVISVGEGNRYGHPAPSVLDRLTRRGIAAFRTDRNDRVVVRSDGHSVSVDE